MLYNQFSDLHASLTVQGSRRSYQYLSCLLPPEVVDEALGEEGPIRCIQRPPGDNHHAFIAVVQDRIGFFDAVITYRGLAIRVVLLNDRDIDLDSQELEVFFDMFQQDIDEELDNPASMVVDMDMLLGLYFPAHAPATSEESDTDEDLAAMVRYSKAA